MALGWIQWIWQRERAGSCRTRVWSDRKAINQRPSWSPRGDTTRWLQLHRGRRDVKPTWALWPGPAVGQRWFWEGSSKEELVRGDRGEGWQGKDTAVGQHGRGLHGAHEELEGSKSPPVFPALAEPRKANGRGGSSKGSAQPVMVWNQPEGSCAMLEEEGRVKAREGEATGTERRAVRKRDARARNAQAGGDRERAEGQQWL